MKRIIVAACAAVVISPAAVAATPTVAQAAPASTTGQTRSNLTAARYAAVSYANKYSRQASSSGAAAKDRHATHLGKLTRKAQLPLNQRARLIAPSLKGIMYRWGGTTTRGFDCSGFTGYVYKKAGKSLPRTAAMQARYAKRTSNPAPGDLVFFGGRNAYHVGIYVGGNRMIHAPRSGKPVQVAKIWSGATYGKIR